MRAIATREFPTQNVIGTMLLTVQQPRLHRLQELLLLNPHVQSKDQRGTYMKRIRTPVKRFANVRDMHALACCISAQHTRTSCISRAGWLVMMEWKRGVNDYEL